MQKQRDVFQAIADPTRREILTLLINNPLSLNGIAENFTMSRPAISQHVKVLDESGLLIIQKRGRQRVCSIEPRKIKEVDEWLEPFKELWEQRFEQLDELLTKMNEEEE